MTTNFVTLNPDAGYVTILNTYTVAPERAEELLQTLVRSTNETLQYVPGFVSASFHMNLDCTQVVNYSQWLSQEAIKAAGTDPKVQASMKEVGQIADKFTPILYDLRDSVMAAPTASANTTTDRAAHVLALMKQGDDAFNSQDYAAMDAGRHPDMIAHVTGSDKPTQGRAAHAAVQQIIFRAFPDVHLHTDSSLIQFGNGDWMTMVCKITGTFTGEMALPDGKVIPGTGKSFNLHFSRTAKWEGEQMVEEYVSWDSALMAQQIGTA